MKRIVLENLVCIKCSGPVKFNATKIKCLRCGKLYHIEHGILLMILNKYRYSNFVFLNGKLFKYLYNNIINKCLNRFWSKGFFKIKPITSQISKKDAVFSRKRDELPDYDKHRSYYNNFFNLARKNGNDNLVLDIACGTGRYFHLLFWSNQIVGIDLSYNMLLEAKNPYLSDNLTSPPILITGSLNMLPFKEDSFDFVFSIGLFGHVVEFSYDSLMKIINTVKPGGNVLLCVYKGGENTKTNNFNSEFSVTDKAMNEIIKQIEVQECVIETVDFSIPSLSDRKELCHTIWITR